MAEYGQMPNVSGIEWRDTARTLSYPFADSSTLISSAGTLLPSDFLLDVVIYCRDFQYPAWLSSAEFNAEGEVLCTFTDGNLSVSGTGVLHDSSGRAVGQMVLGENAKLALSDTLTFTSSATQLAIGCVTPISGNKLSSVVANGEQFSGDVYLAAEQGVKLSLENNEVRIDAYGERIVYDDGDTRKGINGIRLIVNGSEVGVAYPDARGNLVLLSDNSISYDTILRLVAGLSSITFELIGGGSHNG